MFFLAVACFLKFLRWVMGGHCKKSRGVTMSSGDVDADVGDNADDDVDVKDDVGDENNVEGDVGDGDDVGDDVDADVGDDVGDSLLGKLTGATGKSKDVSPRGCLRSGSCEAILAKRSL